MARTFKFEYPDSNKSQEDLLQDAIKTLDKLKEYRMIAKGLKKYTDERFSYVEKHRGEFVHITEGGDVILTKDKSGKHAGIILKIGEEVKDSHASGLYAMAYRSVVSSFSIPISLATKEVARTTQS